MSFSPKSVIHIQFDAGELWFQSSRIWTALLNAETLRKIDYSARQQLECDLRDTALYLAGRNFILRTAVEELSNSVYRFQELVPKPWTLPEIVDHQVRYRMVGGPEITKERDRLLFAVDSFLFEFRAYLELLAQFVYGILVGIGQGPAQTEKLSSGNPVITVDRKGRLKSNNFLLYLCGRFSLGTAWYEFLSRHRNFSTHEGCPYIVLEDLSIEPPGPPKFEIIVMRKNIHYFAQADPADYFRLSQCQAIVDGVRDLSRASQDYLVSILETKRV